MMNDDIHDDDGVAVDYDDSGGNDDNIKREDGK